MELKFRPFPVVGGCYADDAIPFSAQDRCNYLPMSAEMPGARSEGLNRSPPGLQKFATVGAGPFRGDRNVEGRYFLVSGTSLYQLQPSGYSASLGTIPGSGRVSMSHNQIANGNELLIVNGSAGYIYNTVTRVLTRITSDSYPGAIIADFIAQRFIQVEPQGRYFFNSGISAGSTYSALETYEAEGAVDRLVSLIVSHNEVLAFSERTAEIFKYTGTTNALFENTGTLIEQGCGATYATCNLDNSVFFVGADKIGYRINGNTPERITTHAIEQAWSRTDMSKAFAFVWEDRGHKVWYVTTHGATGYTWGYDCATRLWHRRQSFGMNRWRLNTLTKWNGAWYGGDSISGQVYKLDWDYMQEGTDPLVSEWAGPVIHDDQNILTLHAIEFVLDTGGDQAAALASVVTPPLTLSGTLVDGKVGTAYSDGIDAAGGVPAYGNWSISVGTLPAGLSISTSTGLITGTPT